MKNTSWLSLGAFAAAGALVAAATLSVSADTAVVVPAPSQAIAASSATSDTIVLAGGCFWGVQGVYQHMEGVTRAVAGYTGGTTANPSYEQVSTGTTGHAESVEVTYNPSKVSLGQILQVYFSVVQDPTELNRQGPDEGTQYRSEIFTENAAQAQFAKTYIAELDAKKAFRAPIVTKVEPLSAFYRAEGYHQNYATLHPDQAYIAYNDIPKIEGLKQLFPALYRDKPMLFAAN